MATPPPQVHPLRACQLCSHHRTVNDTLHCVHLRANCSAARADGGGCGPNALHMHWPPLEAPTRSTRHELWAATA